MKNKKICLVGAHGTGKSAICKKIEKNCYINYESTIKIISEQFREVVENIPNFTKQTEEITLSTYIKQLYLENLYTSQNKNILCDRSVLDTFVYYDYFNKKEFGDVRECYFVSDLDYIDSVLLVAKRHMQTYSQIYLIEPSNREIEDDGFRMKDKEQQLEVHKLFLEYFQEFKRFQGVDYYNVEVVNQEVAHTDDFVNKITNQLI